MKHRLVVDKSLLVKMLAKKHRYLRVESLNHKI